MKQVFHTIIKPRPDGSYVGWVEEVPGTVTRARSLAECRDKLRESLRLMIETNRSEARLWIDGSCLQEMVELDSPEHGELVMH